jgi:undecaprenyl-diphosphatase
MILDIGATLKQADQGLFGLINGQWTNSFFDSWMPWMRTSNNWYPFYLALIGFVFYRFGWKAWKWLVSVAITVGLSDQISSFFFKPLFHRLRPCADPAMLTQVKLLLKACPTNFSFTSSHATNHFSLAIFVFMTLQPLFKKYSYLFFVWAGIICYAQVYVGVHYPLDVLAGALLGLMIGYAGARVYLKWMSRN